MRKANAHTGDHNQNRVGSISRRPKLSLLLNRELLLADMLLNTATPLLLTEYNCQQKFKIIWRKDFQALKLHN